MIQTQKDDPWDNLSCVLPGRCWHMNTWLWKVDYYNYHENCLSLLLLKSWRYGFRYLTWLLRLVNATRWLSSMDWLTHSQSLSVWKLKIPQPLSFLLTINIRNRTSHQYSYINSPLGRVTVSYWIIEQMTNFSFICVWPDFHLFV